MYEIPLLLNGPWDEEKSASIEDLLSMAEKAGFTGVDLNYQTVCQMSVERIRKVLQAHHLDLTSLICMEHLANTSLSDEEALEPYKDAVSKAKALHCSHLMLSPGWTGEDTDPQHIRQALIRRFRIVAELAASEGIRCMIEDDPNLTVRMCTAKDVSEILQAVPELKIVYDTANMIVGGERPDAFYEAVHDQVIHMHIKDIQICDDPKKYRDEGLNGVFYASVPHGNGMVDFEELFRLFGKYGYQGPLSLEFIPRQEGRVTQEELDEIYRRFAALSSRYTLGVNEVPLLSKLIPGPEEEVWQEIRKRGINGVEICILPEASERLQAHEDEVAARYHNPRPFVRGEQIVPYVERIRKAGLQVLSCHVMLCEAYPKLIWDSVSYLKEVSHSTGIRQFVISCSFETAAMAEAYLPYLQKAASALKEDGICLCYHNHHQDSMPLENGKTVMEMIAADYPDVMIQLDIGWAWYGGMDSIAFMKKYGDRIISVHLKDLTEDARERSDAGRFTAIGAGAVNTEEVLKDLALCKIAPGKLIIDQDASTGDMYDDLAAAVRFVQG